VGGLFALFIQTPSIVVQSGGLVALFIQTPSMVVHRGGFVALFVHAIEESVHSGGLVALLMQAPFMVVQSGGLVALFIQVLGVTTATKVFPLLLDPFAPVQEIVNDLLFVRAPVLKDPVVPVPLPVPALQTVAFVDIQLITEDSPAIIDAGEATAVTVGKLPEKPLEPGTVIGLSINPLLLSATVTLLLLLIPKTES
jgi:hypothetical protein